MITRIVSGSTRRAMIVLIAAALIANHVGTLLYVDMPTAATVVVGVFAVFFISVISTRSWPRPVANYSSRR